jgi:hypothetical protein
MKTFDAIDVRQTPACGCCLQFGTAAHEIGHALGLIHEHSRPDRDLYVRVDPELTEHNRPFRIFPDSDVSTYGMPYDVGSIMHYSIKVSDRRLLRWCLLEIRRENLKQATLNLFVVCIYTVRVALKCTPWTHLHVTLWVNALRSHFTMPWLSTHVTAVVGTVHRDWFMLR